VKMVPRLRFLRPYSVQPLPTGTPSGCSAYLRALMAARLKELRPAGGLEYPRLTKKGKSRSVRAFQAEFGTRAATDLASVSEQYTLCGRVLHVRRFGAKFYIIKIQENGSSTQALVNLGKLTDGTDSKHFKALSMLLKRGDHISVTGRPARSDSMELSIEALHSPQLLSPSIAPLPFQIPQESRMHNRHMDLLLNRSARDTLLVRAFIIHHLREHLHKTLKCVEVQTPILAANAGGAVARPFSTYATEFVHKDMALRIAPELWLKRLIVGGLDRIFEIGPSFRNEGVDATHNPEFTTCEFYLAYTNLDSLLHITENLMATLAKGVSAFLAKNELQVEAPDPKIFEKRFERVEFIPALEEALGQPLPNLDSPRAVTDILKLLEDAGKEWHKSLPPNPSLPKLLDHMAAAVIEPKSSDRPLYIINHPVCMSPLAKSFTCPTTGQQVAARAELFFGGNELANMYEEENDPFKQKRKFVNQAKAKLDQQGVAVADQDDDPAHVIDEQYISVLESGLPPTGGWGCGVDRLVMLFTGSKRISEVLPFGNLRNVVGLAS
ncbi:class II aaRS and biotin synthetase, partial [Cryphonectria parasitica EP155]